MRFVASNFARLSAVVATQVRQWRATDSNEVFEVTSLDNIPVSDWLTNGAADSNHVGTIPYAGSNYRIEIYGRDGTLVPVGEDSPQLGTIELLGAQKGNTLAPLPAPSRFTIAPRLQQTRHSS